MFMIIGVSIYFLGCWKIDFTFCRWKTLLTGEYKGLKMIMGDFCGCSKTNFNFGRGATQVAGGYTKLVDKKKKKLKRLHLFFKE